MQTYGNIWAWVGRVCTDSGLRALVSTPHTGSSPNADQYYWEVRAQFRLKDEQSNKTWVFPAPDPKNTPIDMETETNPDFTRIGRPFWADQETHAATGANG